MGLVDGLGASTTNPLTQTFYAQDGLAGQPHLNQCHDNHLQTAVLERFLS